MSEVRDGAVQGAVSGLAGGLVFGAVMAQIGFLPTVAAIVRVHSPLLGFLVHMLFAAIIGAGFGVLVVRQRAESRELLFWGLVYGALWWFLGPLTLLPVLLGRPLTWDVSSGRDLVPSLIGHLVYGVVTAAVFAWRRAPARRTSITTVARGLAAGVIAALVLLFSFDVMVGEAPYELLLAALFVGAGYPLLFGAQAEGTGPALIRGMVYGFAWWILVVLTVPPLMAHGTLDWSIEAVRARLPDLPGYLLLGAGTGAVFTWLGGLARTLFEDDVRRLRPEWHGTSRLRAAGNGMVAGLAGGLVFAAVMIPLGLLPRVARLVGADSVALGLLVHLLIAVIIGASYGIFFRRRSFDLASGVGWGVCYGVLWWVLGALTLMPVFLGGMPRWAAADLAAAFPTLIGHLAYGAVLGAVYQRLEERISPWWLTRGQLEAERAAALREQALGSAPAIWTLVLMLAVTIPTLVAS